MNTICIGNKKRNPVNIGYLFTMSLNLSEIDVRVITERQKKLGED